LYLIIEGMQRNRFDKKPISQTDPMHLEELFELALDAVRVRVRVRGLRALLNKLCLSIE
jgi:hypothetical protein